MWTEKHPEHALRKLTRTTLTLLLPWLVFAGAMYVVSQYNYLLFHSLAELFSIAVGIAVFMLAWNTRRFMASDFLVLVGLSYLFVGFLDLIHTLSYKGMGLFPANDANLPTQLWVAARYFQSLSLLFAVWTSNRRFDTRSVLFAFTTATVLLLALIATGLFPDCFVDGLTPFKRVSEYVISGIFVIALLGLRRKHDALSPYILRLISTSLILTIVSELAFTFYVSVYGLSNFVGHIFKIIAVYCIYKAIIETGLNQPFDLLFRDMKKREQELEHSKQLLHELATRDALTGLPNRLLFDARLKHAIEKATRANYPFVNRMVEVIIIDVDNFKDINDLLGHMGGDAALLEIAGRLRAEIRESDTVARWGGDEFVCILEDVTSLEDAEQLARKIAGSMNAPVLIQGHAVQITVSLGVSLFPQHGTENDELLRCADAALYRAKQFRNSVCVYEKREVLA